MFVLVCFSQYCHVWAERTSCLFSLTSVRTLVFFWQHFKCKQRQNFEVGTFLKVAGTLKLPPCWVPGLTVSEKMKRIQTRILLSNNVKLKIGSLNWNTSSFPPFCRKIMIECFSCQSWTVVMWSVDMHLPLHLKPLDAVYHSAICFIKGDSYMSHHWILYDKVGWLHERMAVQVPHARTHSGKTAFSVSASNSWNILQRDLNWGTFIPFRHVRNIILNRLFTVCNCFKFFSLLITLSLKDFIVLIVFNLLVPVVPFYFSIFQRVLFVNFICPFGIIANEGRPHSENFKKKKKMMMING